MSISRRNFLTGLVAVAAVAAIPAPAEAAWISIDFGPIESRLLSAYINGKLVKIVSTSPDGDIWTECDTEAGDLIAGRYYKLELKHDDLEPLYITDIQFISDQRVQEPVEGKPKRFFGWRIRDRSKEDRHCRVGNDGPTYLITPEARAGLFFAPDYG